MINFSSIITKKQCPSWPTEREVITTSSCRVGGHISSPSPTVQSIPVKRTSFVAIQNDRHNAQHSKGEDGALKIMSNVVRGEEGAQRCPALR